LEEDVDPEDRIDWCGGFLVGELAAMFVSTHCGEREEKREE
jgi:hypothetical protein